MRKFYLLPFVFGLFAVLFGLEGYGQATDLIISEYAEGSSHNKYIELYNGTGADIDLSDYALWRIDNGGIWPDAATLDLSGTLITGNTYIICNNQASPNIIAQADLPNPFISFNGNDALGLAKNGILIDVIGKSGGAPTGGWNVANITNATQDGKLIRKADVCSPNTNWDVSRGTNATNSEWIVTKPYTADVLTIGSHTMICTPVCTISDAALADVVCDNNSTPTDPNDDIITFNLNPTGDLLGTTYTVSVAVGTISPTSGTYGSATNFSLQSGSAGNGDVEITITDDTDSNCEFTETITDPGVCSIAPKPIDHPTDFQCDGIDIDEISISWTDVNSMPTPTGYLILWSDESYGNINPPIDGEPIVNGTGVLNVAQGITMTTINGLATNTNYFFKIYPYTNSGTDIAYKTDGDVRFTSCSTIDAPCISEGFDNVTTPPTGWGINVGGTYITATNYGISSPSIKFVNTGHHITTSLSTNPASEVSFWLKGQGPTLTSSLLVEGYDGSNWVTIQNINALPTTGITYTYNSSTSPVLPPNLLQFRFTFTKNSGNIAFDDLEVLCTTACVPTHTVEGFRPQSGPEGTLVTLTGTGFTGVSEIRIGGNSITQFSFVNDNTIVITIDGTPTSGLVSVIVADCEVKSADSFTYLKSNGSCSNSAGSEPIYATDLFISEIYDGTGSLSYIEIFNGTDGTINLGADNYSIHVITGPTQIYDLSGNILSGKMHILQIGTGSSECDDLVVNDPRPSAPGFNGDDIVSLYKNGFLLDYVPNPNHLDAGGTGTKAPGFSQSRHDDVTSPSSTYISSEWTISNTENCDDLGIAPYIPGGKNITINIQPLDVDCTELTFSVDATTNISPNVPTTYTWRYAAPGEIEWKLVSALGGTNGLVTTAANKPFITITGNTSILFGYQFYVDMGTGGTGECRRYSNVASYTFGTKSFYRTVSGGDWSNLEIWEMSDVEFGTYEEVCQYPIDRTSDKVTIRDGAHVILDVEIAVEWIDICATCTLELELNEKLTVMNGNLAGPDLIINGTLIDKGNNLNGINFLTPATWQLGSAGTVIKTNTSSVVAYRDNYEVDIANIPASGQWIYRRIDNNNISVASIGMVYPNLSFENDFGSSNYDPVNSLYMFSGNSLPIRIKGDLNVGMDGSGTYTLRTINTFSNPILIEGSLNIGLGSGLYNEAGGIFGTGLEVREDMNIEGTLDLSAGSGANVGVLRLSGDQNMSVGPGPASPTTIIKSNHLEIAKDEGFNLNSKLNFEINESATFTQGILEMENASNTVSFQTGATVSGASNASFVDGKVIKNRAANEEFIFPIGNIKDATNKWYQPARIFGTSGAATIEAQYFAKANPNAGVYYDGQSNSPGDNHHIGNCDYWTITKEDGDNVKLALTYTNDDEDVDDAYCNILGTPDLVFIYSYDSHPAVLDWDYVASGNVGNEIVSIDFINNPLGTLNGTYGDFAFGGASGSVDFLNVLPIQLISFTAKPENQKVQTQWSTHSETNNAFFTVERSADARIFHQIGEVTGAGNSHTTQHYALTDPRPLPNVSYYRLKQTDFDGHASYSDIQAVSFKETDGFSLDQTYRDENELNLVYKSISPYILVEIFDVLGKRVFTQVAENYGGRSVVNPNLGRGAYVVRISAGDKRDTGKIVW